MEALVYTFLLVLTLGIIFFTIFFMISSVVLPEALGKSK